MSSSWEIVEEHVKDALRKAGGNEAKARQHLMAAALNDVDLLQAIAKPHLPGITAHAISRVLRAKTTLSAPDMPEDEPENSFGMDILKTFADDRATQFGQEQYAAPVKKQGVSQRHIDAIRQMVEKSKSNK